MFIGFEEMMFAKYQRTGPEILITPFRAMTGLRIWWNTFTHRVSQEVAFIFLHEFFFCESTVNYRSVMGFHTHWVRGKPRGGRRRDGKIDPCNLTI